MAASLRQAEYAAVLWAAEVLREQGATEVYMFGSAVSGRLREGV